MTSERNYTIHADHIESPDCLAYALDKDKFSKIEIKKITFDHGDTVKTYIKSYGKENLLSTLREILFNPKRFPKTKGNNSIDNHCLC